MLAAGAQVNLDELKALHPLGDTVEAAGVRLRGKGRVRQGVCPFHEEKEGSFTVYGDSERFYCFGCGEGGDVLDFVQRMEDLTLPEAIARLDGGPGRRPWAANSPAGPRQPPEVAALPPRDPNLLTAAARFYAGQLRLESEAQEYLASRGVGPSAAARLGLGYAPGSGLRQALESQGFSKKRLRDSGLFMAQGTERFAGTVVRARPLRRPRPLARWPGHRPRPDAPVPSVARPQAGAGAWASWGCASLGGLGGGGLRLACPCRLGTPRSRSTGHPGSRQGGGGPAGLPPRLPRLRQRRRWP